MLTVPVRAGVQPHVEPDQDHGDARDLQQNVKSVEPAVPAISDHSRRIEQQPIGPPANDNAEDAV